MFRPVDKEKRCGLSLANLCSRNYSCDLSVCQPVAMCCAFLWKLLAFTLRTDCTTRPPPPPHMICFPLKLKIHVRRCHVVQDAISPPLLSTQCVAEITDHYDPHSLWVCFRKTENPVTKGFSWPAFTVSLTGHGFVNFGGFHSLGNFLYFISSVDLVLVACRHCCSEKKGCFACCRSLFNKCFLQFLRIQRTCSQCNSCVTQSDEHINKYASSRSA